MEFRFFIANFVCNKNYRVDFNLRVIDDYPRKVINNQPKYVFNTYRMRLNRIVISLIFAFMYLSATGQTRELAKEVEVTRAYDPIISDAEKITLPFDLPDSLSDLRGNYQYSISQKVSIPAFALRPIQAAKVGAEVDEKNRFLYARLGAGIPFRITGDLYLNNVEPKDVTYGLFYNHKSLFAETDNGIEKTPVDELNHSGGVYFRKYWDKTVFGIEGGFMQHNVLFYGYDPDIIKFVPYTFNKDSLAQSYRSFYVAGAVKSTGVNPGDFQYNIGLAADFFGDNGSKKFANGRMFAMSENKIGGSVYLGKLLGENHNLGIDLNSDIYLRDLSYNNVYNNRDIALRPSFGNIYRDMYGVLGDGKDTSNVRMILEAAPRYTYSSEKLLLGLGVKYTGYNAGAGFKSKIYPIAYLSFAAAHEFVPYATLDGGITMNDYKTISTSNPYISPGLCMTTKPTDQSYVVQAGFKGNIAKSFSYNVYGKYSRIKNNTYFVNSDQELINTVAGASLKNNFELLYDNIRQINIGAVMQFASGFMQASLKADYYHDILDELPTVYNKPGLEIDFDADFMFIDNFIFNFNVHAQDGSVYAYSPVTKKEYKTEGFADLGINAEYIVNRNFSVFVSLNNILNNKYEIRHLYKVPGIGVSGGITVRF